MSSISFGSRPTTKGLRYCLIAVTTASGRWVKVAQPSPWSPGSLVSTLTTTSMIPSGAVQITLTSVIRNGGSPPVGSQGGGSNASTDGRVGRSVMVDLLGRTVYGLTGAGYHA